MKNVIVVFCSILSFAVVAGTDAPPPNYTVPSTSSEPIDSLSELNDDPENPSTLTATEQTTVESNLQTEKTKLNNYWRKRLKTASGK